MNINNNIGSWFFKMRGGLWTLIYVIILFMTRHTDPEIILKALIMVLAGQLWRCWAAGTIMLYRGENVKAENLTTTGPYSLMRNPLYFGNFLIGLGWGIIAGLHAVIIFAVSFYVLYNLAIIPHEEKFLRSKFGLEYEYYCGRVKRFFPVKLNFDDLRGVGKKFDAKILVKSEIHTVISTLIGTVLIIAFSIRN